MKTSIGIKNENLAKVAEVLVTTLADEFVLYTKTRKAHWNVEGPDFYNKHLFFEAQYGQLDDIIDDLAERIRTLGHYAPATLREYLELTHLSEHHLESNDSLTYIRALLSDHESIIIHLRENIENFAVEFRDSGTSDYITGLLEAHEKMAWMLRSHLK
ncbi:MULTISPECIES: Dps family protein [Chryseobacterium]|uniref:Dps family protein n=1 Tax=Chryseobacterium TaxID=59732 RepID=UPI00235A4302|nr:MULTISPECIES: DNA starvation/stationary phase protection protein [unclassified Chryseobacterium]MDC8104584.1 DNA starvation/stationary phase protection protein [Chryseobacterium sp. B21-037]MDQ1806115.1 DNA starvation/stationary phase protection protein [Chryseobacterium sp. CKR4-1]WBV58085.1 DNA starvation/stationary phase protection protein [Chryseobacterium daecheongense]